MGRYYEQLQEWERAEIFRLRSAGISQSEIGRRLGRSKSTISRETRRNSSPRGGYQPVAAERMALRRRHARRGSKIKRLSQLEKHVRDHLAMGQSPEQIAGRLRLVEDSFSISHESIYCFIHSPAGRRERLHRFLAQGKSRRGRRARPGQRKPLIPDRISIQARPSSIKSNLSFGHWEADLMSFGRGAGNALVLTEQSSRFVLAAHQTSKKSLTTAAAIRRLLKPIPELAKLSITFDNGGEFAAHKSLKLDSYFCDPHSPWQKGAVENAIGRLRRFLPRTIKPGELSNSLFNAIITRHNHTPRKCLGFQTPAELFRRQTQNIVALDN
jgi:transposase, IS30 family